MVAVESLYEETKKIVLFLFIKCQVLVEGKNIKGVLMK